MAYLFRRTARAVLGDQTYGNLQAFAAHWRLITQQAQKSKAEAVLGAGLDSLRPTQAELASLHLREVATTLSLGLQYSYNSWIEGDIVEFGTASGFTATVLANAMVFSELSRPIKRLHLFDSFTGLPVPTSAIDQDTFHVRRGLWREGGCKGLSAAELHAACSRILPAERVVIHEGWFKDKVVELPPLQRFGFIHFDGDLYQSTIDALGPLFATGKISNGAMICFDDWNSNQASPEHCERRAWRELVAEHHIVQSEWRSYSTMGKAFFIHDYRR